MKRQWWGLWAILVVLSPAIARAETPEEWVALGRRVHGGFGSYIALGIRIGLDAQQRLAAKPRELDVTYQDGQGAPCPCAADGIMLATTATPGQGSLRVLTKKAGKNVFGIAVIKNVRTGNALRYVVPASARTFLDACNKEKDERGRFDAIMAASEPSLYRVESVRPVHSRRATGLSRKLARR